MLFVDSNLFFFKLEQKQRIKNRGSVYFFYYDFHYMHQMFDFISTA